MHTATFNIPHAALIAAFYDTLAPINWQDPRQAALGILVRLLKPLAMVGFLPDEGEELLVEIMAARTLTDRDADLELGLFTNVAPGETINEASITEPSGTGYARIDLTDGSWTGSGSSRSYPQQTFTAGAGGWTGSIQGYFIATKSAGGTQRLIAIEVDSNGPYTLNENDTYKITPTLTGA